MNGTSGTTDLIVLCWAAFNLGLLEESEREREPRHAAKVQYRSLGISAMTDNVTLGEMHGQKLSH